MTLRRRWLRACLLGELAGFVPPAVTGAALGALGAPDLIMVAALTVAGAAEGAVLGTFQGRVVARAIPAVAARRWARVTAVAAACAWIVGMSASPLVSATGPPALILVAPAAVAALWSMGGLQARVLGDAVDDTHHWPAVTALAWMVGVTIPVVALSSLPSGTPAVLAVLVAVAAAVAMGTTVGAVTGQTLQAIVTTAGDRHGMSGPTALSAPGRAADTGRHDRRRRTRAPDRGGDPAAARPAVRSAGSASRWVLCR